ncbi:MAG: hypothetical protein NVS2B6_17920 [Thermoleophilaceae bacterium]
MRFLRGGLVRGAISACVLFGVLVAGCGGSSKPSGPTHAQFVEQANAACARANIALKTLKKPSRDVKGLIAFADQAAPIAQTLDRDLSRVRAPKQDQAGFNRYLTDQRSGIAALGQFRVAAAHKDAQGLQSAAAALQANRSSDDAARLGLAQCAAAVSPQG